MLFSRKQLFQLIWPLIIEQLLNVLVGMVDVLMVAAVGEVAVAGVSLVDAISILVIQVLGSLATGGAVVCSQFLGKKRPEQACMAAGQLLMVSTLGSAAVAMVCIFGGRGLLGLIFGSVETGIMDNAIIYFRLTAFSYPFLAVYNSCAALYRSMGNSRISMLTSLVMNGMNVIGNAICIFGLKMGVAGVAIPTLIARAFAALLMLYLIHNPKNVLRITSLSDLRPRPQLIRNILSVAVPSGLEAGIFQLGKLILQSLVSTLGTASIAAYAVAGNLVMFLYLPGNALGLAMITIVGRCVGAGEYQQAKKYAKQLIVTNYAFLLVIGTVLGFGRHLFVGFYNLSPEAAVIAAALVLAHTLAMILWPPAFCLPNALRAGLDAKFTMVTALVSMWLFRVGLAYVFVKMFHLGALGVWYAMFIDWVVRLIVFMLRFRGFEKRVRQV